jgi:hypothetical protein
MLTPAKYASRYLPIRVRSGHESIPVHIRRYHLGPPTSVQQELWSALGDHFARRKKPDPSYRLTLTVNNAPFAVGDREVIRMPAVRPFWGKGSPEDCQVVLQLALSFNLTTAQRVQTWADANLGLDCNGFVGNYLFHEWLGNHWRIVDGPDAPGPSKTIDKLFQSVAGEDESGALEDLDDLDSKQIYMVVRTDRSGQVIPGPKPVGHVALTEPGQFIPSFSSMDLTRANDGMLGNPALRTVESAGPVNGVGENWMVFVRTLSPKGVFEVNRDKIRKTDPVKLAPLPADG